MIELIDITKRFGRHLAVDALTLRIPAGTLTVLIGTSGSGKSTTLRMINRLCEPDGGRILLGGEDIRTRSPIALRRHIGYAIQSVGLFPHWTVEQNIAAVPTLLKWPAARIRDRVTALLDMLHLPEATFRHRYPHELSGGQQQRVGVARALAADPDVLLMDEPFGALDPVTRASLQQELVRIQRLSGKTVVLVTHDIDEALLLGQHIVLMDKGRIAQEGPAETLLLAPASDFVRQFVGQDDAGVRLLGLRTVAERVRPGADMAGDPIRTSTTLREALSQFVTRRVDRLPVVDEQGRPAGSLGFRDLLDAESP